MSDNQTLVIAEDNANCKTCGCSPCGCHSHGHHGHHHSCNPMLNAGEVRKPVAGDTVTIVNNNQVYNISNSPLPVGCVDPQGYSIPTPQCGCVGVSTTVIVDAPEASDNAGIQSDCGCN